MFQAWKVPHIVKGLASCLPILDKWRIKRAATGGSDSPRYCYSVWLRHLSVLSLHGFRLEGTQVGELGPGDSIGTGLAALLSGARTYVGIDVVPFSAKADLPNVLQELVRMFSNREAIPGDQEFPGVRPKLESYGFPDHLIDASGLSERAARIRAQLKKGINEGELLKYRAPWNSPAVIAPATLDLMFSQAVLEHVDCLPEIYEAMRTWLKPGGYASHVIDFSAHHLSPFWNGHWAYGDFEWRLVRGRRECLLNRQPLGMHLNYARKCGLDVIEVLRSYDHDGLPEHRLTHRFQRIDQEDRRTRGAVLLLQKPQ